MMMMTYTGSGFFQRSGRDEDIFPPLLSWSSYGLSFLGKVTMALDSTTYTPSPFKYLLWIRGIFLSLFFHSLFFFGLMLNVFFILHS